jgi:alpha-beta hydrolase superfamily lysophospholipase
VLPDPAVFARVGRHRHHGRVTFEPETLTVTDPDGETIFVYRWPAPAKPKGAVHIAHGMGEHARRYDHLAQALTAAGFATYADDHRASGRTGADGPGLGKLGPRGMEGTLDALHSVNSFVGADRPGVPVHLLGHSWGSLLAQRFALQWGGELAGLILSGSTLALPEYLNVDGWNDPFEPAATPYDWLTRDPAEVQKYIADPWCGLEVAFPMEEIGYVLVPPTDAIPTDLPILVFNGTMDAVGGVKGGGRALADAYRTLGVTDVTFFEYEGGRHEMFNEINKDDVIADVVAWLAARS